MFALQKSLGRHIRSTSTKLLTKKSSLSSSFSTRRAHGSRSIASVSRFCFSSLTGNQTADVGTTPLLWTMTAVLATAAALMAVADSASSQRLHHEDLNIYFADRSNNERFRRLFSLLAPNQLHCDAAGATAKVRSPPSVSDFQVMAALEVKEELEKVRLAQLIHDLHELAKNNDSDNNSAEENSDSASALGSEPNRLRRYVTMIGDTITRRKTVTAQNQPRRLSESKLVSASYAIQADGDITADFLKKRVSPDSAQSMIQAIKAGGKLSKPSLLSLIAAAQKAHRIEASLIDLTDVTGEITVVGDLHGSLESLLAALELIGNIGPQGQTVVFNGDFVDRGSQSLECLCIILLLKLAFPRYVYLIRGNHEDDLIASVYGFRDEIRRKYGKQTSDDIWEALTNFFTFLPLAVQTKTAAIVHGGLPSMDFDLEDIAAITLEQRTSLKSPSVEAKTDVAKLVQNCLWSDPDADLSNVVIPNPRGCGVRFGRRVARNFLERSGLKYLIRGHEPVEAGIGILECGHGRQVITVFSAAAYPAGEGTNSGAILQLLPDGTYRTYDFLPQHAAAATAAHESEAAEASTSTVARPHKHNGMSWQAVRSLIAGNKGRLEKAFQERQDSHGKVSTNVWAQVMAEQLELPEMPWKSLQPNLAPTDGENSDEIDWRVFLKNHSGRLCQSGMDTHQLETLHENHKMLWTVFKFLDVDNDGKVGLKEFKTGIALLNKHLSRERQLKDPDALFKVLDEGGRGSIDIAEFEKIFTVL